MFRFLLSALALLCASLPLWGFDNPLSFKYQDTERQYYLYVPEEIAPERPLVVMLHGYTGRAESERPELVQEALRRGFVVCVPQGAADARGNSCWNVGYPFQEGLKTDDIGFLCSLAGQIGEEYSLDKRNFFVTGMSNGGEMCYLLANKVPLFFAGYAPIAGLTMKWIADTMPIAVPVSIMEVHGTADTISEWEGDYDNHGGWGEYISVPEAIRRWADAAGNRREVVSIYNDKVALHSFVPEHPFADSKEILLYEVKGGSHSWSLESMDTVTEIMNFFERQLTKDSQRIQDTPRH